MSDFKNVVIKIGSALLVEDNKLHKKWLESLVQDVTALMKKNIKVTLVSSGSIALGRSHFKHGKNLSLKEKQAAAAIGQIELMSVYRDFFQGSNIEVAQILLTASDCNSRSRYVNCKNTIETLHQKGILPIINENDSVAIDEIKIGDNDRLAARVAQMAGADLMILFSDIDGLYDKNPHKFDDAKFIKEVEQIDEKIEKMASDSTSKFGTGGMKTKIMAVKMLSNSGCQVIITKGSNKHSLKNLLDGKQDYTIFHNRQKSHKSRKKWLSGILNSNSEAKGEIIINECAKEVLLNKKVSLLPIGVVAVKGNFKSGDLVLVKDEEDNQIASGLTNHSNEDLKKIFVTKSDQVKKILGAKAKPEVIHIDNLVIN